MSSTLAAPLAPLTTLRVGGPAGRLVAAATEDELVDAVSTADAHGEPLLLLAGGSNVVIADEGFPGLVVRVETRGTSRTPGPDGRMAVEVAAGEPWDGVVAACVADGLTGLECLSGIPGSTGATPIQNVGAYGQEVADTIVAVRALDRARGEPVEMSQVECGLRYRSSALRGDERYVVLSVTFALARGDESEAICYPELARRLGVGVGERAPLADVREAVLDLRRSKGMVIDPSDPDSVSVGSFFTNPILEPGAFADLQARAAERVPAYPEPDGRVKTSAAWLIERAGFTRGYGEGRVGLSTKHTLAIVNRGGASAAEVIELARELAGGVEDAFGIALVPEPALVGLRW